MKFWITGINSRNSGRIKDVILMYRSIVFLLLYFSLLICILFSVLARRMNFFDFGEIDLDVRVAVVDDI